jgi:3-hydroxyanthranilate 3,4-dioxygenase
VGDIFLLPPRVPHSPQRPEGTVGLVIERRREAGEVDHLRWYCEKCRAPLHDATFELKDLGTQLKPMIESFYATPSQRTCRSCGTVMQPPPAAAP